MNYFVFLFVCNHSLLKVWKYTAEALLTLIIAPFVIRVWWEVTLPRCFPSPSLCPKPKHRQVQGCSHTQGTGGRHDRDRDTFDNHRGQTGQVTGWKQLYNNQSHIGKHILNDFQLQLPLRRRSLWSLWWSQRYVMEINENKCKTT